MKLTIAAAVIWLCIIIAVVWGWVLNALALIHSDHLTGLVIARAIGAVVVPFGAILGWFA